MDFFFAEQGNFFTLKEHSKGAEVDVITKIAIASELYLDVPVG